jgi:hypothetical protein
LTEKRREVKVMEFRNGMRVSEWGVWSFLEKDEAGDLLVDECREPKFMTWKVEEVWGEQTAKGKEVAWCFRPRWEKHWTCSIEFADGLRCYDLNSIDFLPAWMKDFKWELEERLVCGHKVPELEGQDELF